MYKNDNHYMNGNVTPASIYKVVTTPGAERIFENIDARRNLLFPTFEQYAKKDVVEYIDRNEQTFIEKKMREDAWKILREIIEPHIRNDDKKGYLALGGSTLSRLATVGADLDLCYAIRSSNGQYEEDGVNLHVLSRIYDALKVKGNHFIRSAKLIQARVPLLKLQMAFPYHNIQVDINCNCVAGIYNSHLLYYYAKLDERFVQMNMILKEWGKINHVIDPRYGKLNSYTVSLMIIHFLQCGVSPPILPNLYSLFPQYFNGTANIEELNYKLDLKLPDIPHNDRTVGELIYGFFEYYSRYDYDNWGISIKDGKLFDRNTRPEEEKQFLFFLEEAYDGMTVPKNLTRRDKLHTIVRLVKAFRSVILSDICKQFAPPHINESWDYICQEEVDEQQNDSSYNRNWRNSNNEARNANRGIEEETTDW